MSVAGYQEFFQGGNIVHLALASSSWVQTGGWKDVGTIKGAIALSPQPRDISVIEYRQGSPVTMEKRNVDPGEGYDIETYNVAIENAALVVGGTVQTYSVAASANTSVTQHLAYDDSYLPIINSSGDRVYNIATFSSLTASGSGGATYVRGTDYDYTDADLKLGRIRILPTFSGTDGVAPLATFTPTAVTSAKRLVYPGTAPILRVLCEVIWTEQNYGDIRARDDMRAYVSNGVFTPVDGDYGTMKFRLQIESDINATTNTRGRLIHPLGSVANNTTI